MDRCNAAFLSFLPASYSFLVVLLVVGREGWGGDLGTVSSSTTKGREGLNVFCVVPEDQTLGPGLGLLGLMSSCVN